MNGVRGMSDQRRMKHLVAMLCVATYLLDALRR